MLNEMHKDIVFQQVIIEMVGFCKNTNTVAYNFIKRNERFRKNQF